MASRVEAQGGRRPGGPRRARAAGNPPADVGEGHGLPAAPSLPGSVRAALHDAYFHSWRLLPANVVWAVVAIAILTANYLSPAALVLLPVLALPTAGLFRVATRIVRGESVSFWDAIDAWRVDVRTTLTIGVAVAAAVLVLGANLVLGLGGASPLGWFVATLAGWGLVAGWLVSWTLWPILVDPRRSATPVRDRARLAALLVLAHPVRIAALAVVLGLFLVVSALAVVALVTISMALATLVASRYVLPAADRLEARLASRAAATAALDGVADRA